MKTIIISLTLILSLSAFSKNMDEKVKVKNTIDRMVQALKVGNIQGVLDTYEQTAKVVSKPGVNVTGVELKKMFLQIIQMNPVFSFPKHEIIIVGNIAVHTSTWIMEATTPDGKKIKDSGLSVVVLRKQKNGNWLMILDNPNGGHLLKENKNN
jgi:ketosteroid isomerase-like protein